MTFAKELEATFKPGNPTNSLAWLFGGFRDAAQTRRAVGEKLGVDCDLQHRHKYPANSRQYVGLRLVGRDVIKINPSLSLREKSGAVIDVNGNPGFHDHYDKN